MHLQYQSIVNPIFLDNTEEYDMLKSAGLVLWLCDDSNSAAKELAISN